MPDPGLTLGTRQPLPEACATATVLLLHARLPFPLDVPYHSRTGINCVAFPDDGAAKRFAHMFQALKMEIVICGKVGRSLPPSQGPLHAPN